MKLYSEGMQIMVYYKVYYNPKEWKGKKKDKISEKIYHHYYLDKTVLF